MDESTFERHAHFMRLALQAAEQAQQMGEVPVGAVLVCENTVIATGSNCPIQACDPSAHAEMNALRAAGQQLGNYRLPDCTLYVTLEPCVMCAGAILHARIAHLIFGAKDPKTGSCGSVLDVFALQQLNHQTQVRAGVLEAECAHMLSDFFRQRRAAKKQCKALLNLEVIHSKPF